MAQASRAKNILWYPQPASIWEEALPLGNGRLGAMVFGTLATERIQLNEDTIWGGSPHRNDNPRAREYLDEVRRLIFAGKYEEAQILADRHFIADQSHGMPYQTVGSLEIDFPEHQKVQEYRRELDLDEAAARVSYQAGGIRFHREVIASLAHPAIIIRLEADQPGALDLQLRWTSPMQSSTALNTQGQLLLCGQGSGHEGVAGAIRYEARVQILEQDGQTCTMDEPNQGPGIRVTEATRVTAAIVAASNFVSWKDISADPGERNGAALSSLAGMSWQELREAHGSAWKAWFRRADLDLGTNSQGDLPTDQRITQFGQADDKDLAALYFQYGRYLLIACSQPGTQAATLQGIWNDHILPPWDSKYTTNINLEMNYWPALNTNLLELQEPLLRLVEEVSEAGKDTARTMYGASGWCLHHNTDIWRSTGAVDRWETSAWAVWPACGAWLCQHGWFQYQYSGDEDWIARIWPVMKGAADFFLDALVPKPGTPWLVLCPSLSPENFHHHKAAVADGVAMDSFMIRDLFGHILEAGQILKSRSALAEGLSGMDEAWFDRVRETIQRLPPPRVGRWGQLQEWYEDWDREDDRHRHISHLWGLYPGNQISLRRTPALAAAARTSLEHRGDQSTGWSTAWKINCWARLGEGDRAWELLKWQLRPANTATQFNEDGGSYPNLMDACAPWQIDGNFGCSAGIAELLLQSHDGDVHLLPALPWVLDHGRVSGLTARGGFVVDLEWKDHRLLKARIHANQGGNLRLRYQFPLKRLDGKALVPAQGINPNPCFSVICLDQPDPSAEELGAHRQDWVADVPARPGETLTFVAAVQE